jgi:hypothetical protein
MVGWGAEAVSFGAVAWTAFGHSTSRISLEVISVLSLLWAMTLVCPLIWIVAWFQARRPEQAAPLPERESIDPEGAWPPPPNTDPGDR